MAMGYDVLNDDSLCFLNDYYWCRGGGYFIVIECDECVSVLM